MAVQTKILLVKLTQEEMSAKAQELATEVKTVDELREKKKQQSGDVAAQIKEHEARVKRLSDHIATGKEEREVEIEERPNYDDKTIETVRRDTGEVITRRVMTQEERQVRFMFREARKAANDKDAPGDGAANGPKAEDKDKDKKNKDRGARE